MQNFAVLMNAKAKELGCQESHFNNPSGLNDPQHYTSAYDMALIAQAAFQNETFVTIDSSLYYDLPPTRHDPVSYTHLLRLIELYRETVNGNLEKLHHRCDEFVKGLKFIVPTVLLAFACYALQIVLQIL